MYSIPIYPEHNSALREIGEIYLYRSVNIGVCVCVFVYIYVFMTVILEIGQKFILSMAPCSFLLGCGEV